MSNKIWQRTISEKHPAILSNPTDMNLDDIQVQLAKLADDHKFEWLLAYADDGVIWGKIVDCKLITAYDAAEGNPDLQIYCPQLRVETLQEARLFGEKGEMLLLREGKRWKTHLIRDTEEGEQATWQQSFDESQLLWGTHGTPLAEPFTLLQDGAQGLRHAVPVKLKLGEGGKATPPRLIVRHYLNLEGPARIVTSRLVTLEED